MGKLSTAQRKKIPKSKFGLPSKKSKKNPAGRGGYPMPDRSHAANAKARATQAVKAGRMSPATAAKIKAKANRILGKKGKK